MQTRLAITPGEPAGIGPELVLMLAQQPRHADWLVFADAELLQMRAEQCHVPITLTRLDELPRRDEALPAQRLGELLVHHVPLRESAQLAQPNPRNARAILQALDAAVEACLSGHCDALVTAPMHKGVINDAGIAFSGHTEYLAERSGGDPVMLLTAEHAAPPLRVALATTHLPLREVAGALNPNTVRRVLQVLHTQLQLRFGIERPRLLVAGINPHAGEGGHLGTEEIDWLEPLLNELRQTGLAVRGPLPADTLFTRPWLEQADAVLAMYHDQGLPVLKHVGFGRSVNVTLGLPIIRTSVDHGTAFDKAGTASADTGSLAAALELADQLARHAQR